MTKYMPFVFDDHGHVTNQKCFIITGENTAFLTAFFNSSLFKFCFRESFPELQGGTRELSKIFFDKIPVLKIDSETEEHFSELVRDLQCDYSAGKAKHVDKELFELYRLSLEEQQIIGYIEIQ